MLFFQDNFERTAAGSYKNFPIAITSPVVSEWHETHNGRPYAYRKVADGKVYRRHEIYHHSSPYGWEIVKR